VNGEMQMGPPPGGDPAGLAIVIAGIIVTVFTIVVAVRASLRPEETDPLHPKYSILRDDR
jgi:hypothetical protein